LIYQVLYKYMTKLSTKLRFFLNLTRVQSITTRRFDAGLGGLGLSEFMILFHLSLAEDEKMRRIDLAEALGLTASGITRLLLPMEKIGLVKKEVNERDARVSFVQLAPGGKRQLGESLERAELLAEDLVPDGKAKQLTEFIEVLKELGGLK
jgi:DNA-binding MarR family transcriptional regulator